MRTFAEAVQACTAPRQADIFGMDDVPEQTRGVRGHHCDSRRNAHYIAGLGPPADLDQRCKHRGSSGNDAMAG